MLAPTQEAPDKSAYIKVPNVQGLYRHATTGRYYGCKKVDGRRKERSLGTTDRKIAERRLKEWISNLGKGNDPVGTFLKERCVLDPAEKMVKSDLFAEFTDWCVGNGLSAEKMENFFWKTLFQRRPELTARRHTIAGKREHCIVGISVFDPCEKSTPQIAPSHHAGTGRPISPAFLNSLKREARSAAVEKEAANRTAQT
jgi:phage/plasmid-associated DNA primase